MTYNAIFDKRGTHRYIFFADRHQVIMEYYFGEGTIGQPDIGEGGAGMYKGDLATYQEQKKNLIALEYVCCFGHS